MSWCDYHKLQKECNTWKLKYEILEENVKSEIFKKVMKKLDETEETKRLREENLKYRKEIKKLKEELKNGNNENQRRKNKKL